MEARAGDTKSMGTSSEWTSESKWWEKRMLCRMQAMLDTTATTMARRRPKRVGSLVTVGR